MINPPDNQEQRAKQIFGELLDLPAVERQEYLEHACGREVELAERVRSLMAAHQQSHQFMSRPTELMPGPLEISTSSGTSSNVEISERQIGPYQITEKLGEGGFGIVFLAHQESPVKRMVALKIIKLGMDTREIVARFDTERQALAMMNHPSIAKVFDAGATDSGRPFFVMEYVPGESLIKYAKRHRLSIRDRARLFLKICNAVQHAHQKGVIHRDIKPSNVLVNEIDNEHHPKVIDFGIAKATTLGPGHRSQLTRTSQLLGTPEFMAPEQASVESSDIDIRADVYSLGVLLFYLMTGSGPYDRDRIRNLSIGQLENLFENVEPKKPSLRLSEDRSRIESLAQERRTDPGRLLRDVSGELDWIILKAIEKDAQRRYQTVEALAEDVSSFISDKPVRARPPSLGYRVGKIYRRHRVITTIVGVSVVLLITLSAISTFLAFEATKSRNNEIRLRNDAEQNAYVGHMAAASNAIRDNNSVDAARHLERAPVSLRGAEHDYLTQLVDVSQFVYDPVAGQCHDAAFSADGRLLASCWPDRFVRILDCVNHSEVRVLEDHPQDPVALAFAPDGQHLFCGYVGGALLIWDLSEPTVPIKLPSHSQTVTQIAVSQDGTRIVTACRGGLIQIWSWPDQKLVHRIQAHDGGIDFVVVSPNGARIASSGWDQLLRLWNGQTGEEIRATYCARASTPRSEPRLYPSSRITALTMSSDGSRIASGAVDGMVRVFDVDKLDEQLQVAHSPSFVRGLAFDATGERLMIARKGKTLSFVSLERPELANALVGHSQDVRGVACSDSSGFFVSYAFDRSLRLWSIENGKPLGTFLGHSAGILDLILSQDGQRCATRAIDGTVRLWNLSHLDGHTVYSNDRDEVFCKLAVAKPWCVLVGRRGTPRVVDIRTGQIVTQCQGDHQLAAPPRVAIDAQATFICVALAHNPDLGVFSLPSGRLIGRLSGHQGLITSVEISPDGSTILSSAHDGTVRLWDANRLAQITVIRDENRYVQSAAFYSNDSILTYSNADDLQAPEFGEQNRRSLLRLYDLPSGSVAKKADLEANLGESVIAVSPDRQWVALAPASRTVRLFNLDTMKSNELRGHVGMVQGISWMPDSQRLVTASRDQTVRFWSTTTSEAVGVLNAHDAAVTGVAVSPDGTVIVTVGEDRTVRFWRK